MIENILQVRSRLLQRVLLTDQQRQNLVVGTHSISELILVVVGDVRSGDWRRIRVRMQ